jgi:diaminohydroxyphosphoribosylaminopyrimidine deaminase/5-amino-6-(5-phosphoribosylamino)uracil reductase
MSAQTPHLYQNIDEAYIAQCLKLAELGTGTVSPNPLVGAIVLDAQGRKVGEGYHQRAGEPHAEIIALDQAGERARGGTLYINLEPCNHHGRTAPCTERIIASGISRVVCGTLDPNPLVAGAGRDMLQNNRISVRYGYLEAECKKLNEIFFKYIVEKTPFVAVKLGLTLDGKIANRQGESRWLTGSFSRQYVHHLRHRYDAILTTAETVITDNPQLNVREIPNIKKQPIKIILDRRFRLNVDKYKVFKGDAPVWVVTSPLSQNHANAQRAKAQGIRVIEIEEAGGKIDLKALMAFLGEEEISSVFVESGGQLVSSLIQDALVSKFYLFYAPKVLQDVMAKPGFGNRFQLDLPQAPQLEIIGSRQLEHDWVVEAQPYTAKRREKPLDPATAAIAKTKGAGTSKRENGNGKRKVLEDPSVKLAAPMPYSEPTPAPKTERPEPIIDEAVLAAEAASPPAEELQTKVMIPEVINP